MTRDPAYLRHIRQALARIRTYTARGKKAFMSESMIQDATIRNLEIIGEASKRVSAEFRSANPDIPWSSMAGMRDILIHNYMGVDLEIVWDVIANRIGEIENKLAAALDDKDD